MTPEDIRKRRTALIRQALDNKPDHSYRLIKDIRSQRLYKDNIQRRDRVVRAEFADNLKQRRERRIVPGQVIMFDYLYPKTEAELQYYDAKPCTIFFNVVKIENGEKRVLGFNLHYYPPRIRYLIMDRIFEIFGSTYRRRWDKILKRPIEGFDYHMLIKQLQKAKLDFGVRMYIPKLMTRITPVPPALYSRAVLTEGHFRKETREQILSYWRNKGDDIVKEVNKKKAK